MTLLDLVLFLPLIGFFLLLLVPKDNPQASRIGALIISLVIFVASLRLLAPFWFASPTGLQFSTNVSWIDYPPIRYHVALDVADRPGVLARVAETYARHEVSIKAVRQEGRGEDAQLVIVTHIAPDAALSRCVTELEMMDSVRAVASVMRVEGEPDE